MDCTQQASVTLDATSHKETSSSSALSKVAKVLGAALLLWALGALLSWGYQGRMAEVASAKQAYEAACETFDAQKAKLAEEVERTPKSIPLQAATNWLAEDHKASVTQDQNIFWQVTFAKSDYEAATAELDRQSEKAYQRWCSCIWAQRTQLLKEARKEAKEPMAAAESLQESSYFGALEVALQDKFESSLAKVRLMSRGDLTWHPDQLKEATGELVEVNSEVKDALDTIAVERKAAAKRAAAAAAAASSQTQASRYYGSGTGSANAYKGQGQAASQSAAPSAWHVNYRNEYGTSEAAADGAVTQWADNYFIAHNWSDNGKMISSQPEYVEVNGTTYKFVNSAEVSRDTYYEEISDWATGNGGIAFQTCVKGGGYLVNHYEPVG